MYNRYIFPILTFITLFISLQAHAAPPVYVQISNSEDQLTTIDTLNRGLVVIMDKPDSISGFDWDPKSNELTAKEDGVYFIMAVAQMGARESSSDIVKGGDVYLWFDINNKPISNSGNWIFVSPTAKAHTIVDQMAISLKAGDKFRIKFSSSSPSVGLISFPATELWPASPGITLTIYKIGDLIPAK